MTEQELKEKIARIIAKHLCKNRYSHFQLYGDSANCYSRENFAECEAVCNAVDELIAEGLDFDHIEFHYVENKYTETALRQKMIKEYESCISEWKHRARLTERALFRACGSSQMMLVFLKQAEKELREERKDE